MTDEMMNLRAFAETAPDADLLREMIGFAAERRMGLEVGGLTGAAHGVKDPTRRVRRAGYRDRDWETRAGTAERRIPTLRRGSHVPGFLEPRRMADQIRPKVPKLATLMDDAEHDVLACMPFPKAPRAKLHSTNPIERLNGKIKRRTDGVGIFPNDEALVRLVGALPLEQNDERAVQRSRGMTLETIAPIADHPLVSLPAVAR